MYFIFFYYLASNLKELTNSEAVKQQFNHFLLNTKDQESDGVPLEHATVIEKDCKYPPIPTEDCFDNFGKITLNLAINTNNKTASQPCNYPYVSNQTLPVRELRESSTLYACDLLKVLKKCH